MAKHIHQNVHFKRANFILCEIHFKKVDFVKSVIKKKKETGKEIEWEPAINIAIYIGSWGGVRLSHPPGSGPSAGQSLPTLHHYRGHLRAGAQPSNVLGPPSRTD